MDFAVFWKTHGHHPAFALTIPRCNLPFAATRTPSEPIRFGPGPTRPLVSFTAHRWPDNSTTLGTMRYTCSLSDLALLLQTENSANRVTARHFSRAAAGPVRPVPEFLQLDRMLHCNIADGHMNGAGSLRDLPDPPAAAYGLEPESHGLIET
jgi:hypothetical protein